MTIGALLEYINNALGEDFERLVTPKDLKMIRDILVRGLILEAFQ